jgi:hypothetical protein
MPWPVSLAHPLVLIREKNPFAFQSNPRKSRLLSTEAKQKEGFQNNSLGSNWVSNETNNQLST